MGRRRKAHSPATGAIKDWRPEDVEFWNATGRKIARRNLWISVPCLLLSFAVWMVWSVVVAKLPAVGFAFSTGQLFWLAAMPGLSGATLRVVYAFMPAMFGGRLWTTLTTWSLLIPAVGMGFAVQDPTPPTGSSLRSRCSAVWAAATSRHRWPTSRSSFPRPRRAVRWPSTQAWEISGSASCSSSCLWQSPRGVLAGSAGHRRRATQAGVTTTLWLQNAGFVFVPFIVASASAAWFGMNDIATMKASFADHSVILAPAQLDHVLALYRHVRLLHWLLGGFPLLSKILFPGVNALAYAFLGPLVGALARALAGKPCDRFGGARSRLGLRCHEPRNRAASSTQSE